MITLPFLLTALVVVLMPGTGVIYTLSCGLISGPRAAVLAAVGCTFGILPHLAASLLGVAAILHAGAVAFQAVKILGAVYLGFLAWVTWREAGTPLAAAPQATGARRLIVRGIALNLLNPKLTVFFLAFLPQFVSPDVGIDPTRQMALLSLVFMAMTFAVFVVYGVCAAAARRRILESTRVMLWLRRGFAAIFAALGIRLAVSAD